MKEITDFTAIKNLCSVRDAENTLKSPLLIIAGDDSGGYDAICEDIKVRISELIAAEWGTDGRGGEHDGTSG